MIIDNEMGLDIDEVECRLSKYHVRVGNNNGFLLLQSPCSLE